MLGLFASIRHCSTSPLSLFTSSPINTCGLDHSKLATVPFSVTECSWSNAEPEWWANTGTEINRTHITETIAITRLFFMVRLPGSSAGNLQVKCPALKDNIHQGQIISFKIRGSQLNRARILRGVPGTPISRLAGDDSWQQNANREIGVPGNALRNVQLCSKSSHDMDMRGPAATSQIIFREALNAGGGFVRVYIRVVVVALLLLPAVAAVGTQQEKNTAAAPPWAYGFASPAGTPTSDPPPPPLFSTVQDDGTIRH